MTVFCAASTRLYEEWGLLMPVPRDENGYRRYSQAHLEQMRLARYALRCEFAAGKIREKATAILPGQEKRPLVPFRNLQNTKGIDSQPANNQHNDYNRSQTFQHFSTSIHRLFQNSRNDGHKQNNKR